MQLLFITFLFISHGFADEGEPTALEGDWVRVLDGCENLPDEEVRRLPENGGGNQVSRAENLSFRSNTFNSRIRPALRCEPDLKATGPKVALAKPECSGGTTSGSFRIDSTTRFNILATQMDGDNPWGVFFQDFDYELIDGNVLFIHPVVPDGTCIEGDKRIYFIRMPTS